MFHCTVLFTCLYLQSYSTNDIYLLVFLVEKLPVTVIVTPYAFEKIALKDVIIKCLFYLYETRNSQTRKLAHRWAKKFERVRRVGKLEKVFALGDREFS